MDRKEFIQRISKNCKLIRTEYGYSQDQMSLAIGVSKKSLVETEKGRRLLGWNEAVTVATVFAGSNILQNEFGGELSDMIRAIAFDHTDVVYPQTMGGKIWWKVIEEKDGYRLQQNILSGHYRLLDPHDGRMMSSFDLEEIRSYMNTLSLFDYENK